jgi:tetratricopeptide (TPR) repeat protein
MQADFFNLPPQDHSGQDRVKSLVQRYETMRVEGRMRYLETDVFLKILAYYADEWALDKALQAADYGIAQHPFNAKLQWRKAQILQHQQDFAAASLWIERALALDPSNLDLRHTQIEIALQAEHYAKALYFLAETLPMAKGENRYTLLLLKAAAHEGQSDFQEALNQIQTLLHEKADYEPAYHRLWKYLATDDLTHAVIKTLERVLDQDPYAHWAWFNLGQVYQHLGIWEKALEAYDYAIVVYPSFEFAYRHCVSALLQLKDYEKAFCYLEEYLEHFQPDARILLQMGECFEYRNQFDKALNFYQQALRLSQLNGQVAYRIGCCCANQERWEKALTYFDLAYQANPRNQEFCLALAEVYNQLHQPQQTHQFYQLALELAPGQVQAWLGYVEFLIDEELFQEALQVLQQARQYCQDGLLDTARAALLLLMGHRKEGFLRLAQVLEQQDKAPEIIYGIAPDLEDDAQVRQFVADWYEARQRSQS